MIKSTQFLTCVATTIGLTTFKMVTLGMTTFSFMALSITIKTLSSQDTALSVWISVIILGVVKLNLSLMIYIFILGAVMLSAMFINVMLSSMFSIVMLIVIALYQMLL